MANIVVNDNSKMFQIQRFLGLNENMDGDTQLKLGEASNIENFKVTQQYHLQGRPGTRAIKTFEGSVRGLWSGYVAGRECMLCAADGAVWDLSNETARRIGDIYDDETTFFGFNGKVYILNGHEYLFWDGEGYVDVVQGYVPLVATAVSPAGGGTTLENINLLTGKRRIQFSADGSSTEYVLPEKNLLSVEKITTYGSETPNYTADLESGKVTFETAPEEGSANVEIIYSVKNILRSQVESMRFCESFNGATETRIFLYGNGTAKTIYCGVTTEGLASAEYFPDLYEITVGDANTPITGMVKHYDRLLTFKPDGAFATNYSAVTLPDGTVTAGFYTVPLNREIGNEAVGQVRLVYNYPRTMYHGSLYDWKMTSSTVRDERNAKLISERVKETLSHADTKKCAIFDDDGEHEYYVFLNDAKGTALVHQYIENVWYKYTNLPVKYGIRFRDKVYFGMSDGRVCLFSSDESSDDGVLIPAVYESGNMDFGVDFKRKHSSVVLVSLKPDANARITVTAKSDRRGEYAEKTVVAKTAGFDAVDFGNWSFQTNYAPKMTRIKLKVKKFVYYKLILKNNSVSSKTSVLGVDIKTRYTGYVK